MAKKAKINKINSSDTPRFKEPVEDYNKLSPVFSFRHMKYGSRFCISQCSTNDRSDFAHQLIMISQRTWDQIDSTYRKALGYEHIPKKQFHATSFPKIVTPDVRSFIVFAYSHGGRMAGIRQNDIFHVILVGDNLYKH